MQKLVLAAFLCAVSSAASAAPGDLIIPHHGRLLDDKDAPIDGSVTFKFVISPKSAKPASDTGEQDDIRWTETQTRTVKVGLYSALLGSVTPLPTSVFADLEVAFLGVSVNGVEFPTRLRIGSSPYAAVAGSAKSADTAKNAEHAVTADTATSATTAAKADSAKAADKLSAACDHCVTAAQIDASAIAVNPANFANGSIPLEKLSSGSAGIDAATVKGKSPADGTGAANAGKLAVLDGNGLIPSSMLSISSDALSLRGKIPADISASGSANGDKLALLTSAGLLPTSVIPPLPASAFPANLTVDSITAGSIKIGNASIFAAFDGLTKACPGGTALSTFNATTVTWSTCPTTWNCSSAPSHAGCVSSSQYQSCKAIKADTAFNGASGLYFVDPDGTSGNLPPMQAYCDMATDGGGWTLVVRITPNPGWAHDDCGTVGAVTAIDQASTGKWSDQAINALGATLFKMSCKDIISYWDAPSRSFNACSQGGQNRRGKNGINDSFINLGSDDSGRGLVSGENQVGNNSYYGYNPANGGTPGCHMAGWGGSGWVMAR